MLKHLCQFGTICACLALQAVPVGQSPPPAPGGFRVVEPTSPPTTGSSSDISVLTWNIKVDDYSEAHARAAMARSVAVSPTPQVIVIQEAYKTRYSIYQDELQRRTGVAWYGAFAVSCPPGGWNGSSCTVATDQGIGIFSSFPIVDNSSIQLPFADCWTSSRPGLRAAIIVNGRTVQVFNTHLQTGNCNNVAQQRYSSMSMLKSWMGSYSKPQLLGGDFNADPDQIMTTQGMSPNFVDSWAIVGSGGRFTYPVSSPTMKLDYLMFDKSTIVQPLSSTVVTSTGSTSDHYPVRGTFRIH